MSKNKIKFNKVWLEKSDKNGNVLMKFLKQINEEEVLCDACIAKINITHSGFGAIQNHLTTNKHDVNVKSFFNKNQSKINLSVAGTSSK